MTDPFQSASGATAVAVDNDPFASPATSSFPKLEDLNGKLLIIIPNNLETVLKNPQFAKTPGETEERVTADIVVVDGDEVTEINDMWLNQQSLVGQLKSAMRKGQPVLGRLRKFPLKAELAKYPTWQARAEADAAWLAAGAMGPRPGYTWKLEDFERGSADHKAAMEYWNSKKANPFG